MPDLEDRFRRLDRLDVPDLWHEALARAAEPAELARRSLPDLGSGAMSTAVRITLAAAAVLAVAFVGFNLLLAGGTDRVGGPTAVPSSVPPSIPSPTATPLEPSAIDAGFIGLPPEGSTPSSPEDGVLVDSYVFGGEVGHFRGMVRLYDDGRLIWYELLGSQNATGYVEQRLTPEGVELVRTHASLREKDPLNLPSWLPPSAWEDQTIRAYIPRGYAACLAPYHPAGEQSEALALLPDAAAELLRDKETVPSDYYGEDSRCLALTTDEARQLDVVLSDSGLAQDPIQNGFTLQYYVGGTDTGDPDVVIIFEPIFPDGTIGCSGCR